MLMSKTRLPLYALILTALFPVVNAMADPPTEPVVSNVQVAVRGNYVDVTYDLEQLEGLDVWIYAKFSKDGGVTFPHPIITAEGDFHTKVTPGIGKQFTWNAYADYPGEHIMEAGIRIEFSFPTLTILLPGDVPMEFMPIRAGTYMRGAYPGEEDAEGGEYPQHQVTLTQDFWMGKYPVTQAQWWAIMGAWPNIAPSSGNGLGDDFPIYNITYGNASSFVTALNAYNDISAEYEMEVHIPTEAQWEYACRAGTTTRFYWGDDPIYLRINEYAWHGGNSSGSTQPVGQMLPNAWGLHDMSGNVMEWCRDREGSYPSGPVTDPYNTSGGRLIMRGGFRSYHGRYLRSARRYTQYGHITGHSFGFRVSASLSSP